MLNIGCHLSAAKGYMNMGKEAKSIDANTFQFFTRNPRGGKAKAIDEQDVKSFLEFMKENNLNKVILQVQLHKVIWDPNMKGV